MIPNNISHRFAATPLLATVVIFLVALFGASMHSARAQTATNTWTGAATKGGPSVKNNWDNGDNWTSAGTPVAGSVLIFDGTSKLLDNINNFSSGFGVWSIVFAPTAGAFTLNGNAITLTNGITNSSANTQTLNLSGITLGGAQTFNALSNNLVFTSLNNITNGGFLLTIAGSFDTTFEGIISGSGGLSKTGAGTLTLSNANTYTGTTTVTGGRLLYGVSDALATNGGVTVNGATAVFDISTFSDTVGAVTLTDGSIAGTTGVLSGASYSVVNGSITAALGGAAATMSKTGIGTVTLGSATNSYGGTTTVGGGVLRVGTLANAGANSSIGTNATVILTNGGVLDYTGATVSVNRGISLASGNGGVGVSNSAAALTVSGAISGSGSLVKTGAGTLVLAGATNSYGGTTTVGGGVLQVGTLANAGANSSIGTNATVVLTNGGVLDYTGATVSVNRGISLASGNGGVGVSNSAAALTVSGAVSGSGSLVKTGAGTLVLASSNTFTGAVNVQAGLLNLNSASGSAAGSATSVSVSSGATLLVSQNNQVNNAASVSLSGGTIRRASGVSEVFGNLTVSSDSFLDFGTGTTGTLSFGTYIPSSLLTVNNFLPGDVLTFGSNLTATINNASLFSFSGGFTSSWNSGTLTFTITAVPEPSTYLAAAGLLAMFLWPSRKRILRYAKRTLGLRAPTRDRLAARQA